MRRLLKNGDPIDPTIAYDFFIVVIRARGLRGLEEGRPDKLVTSGHPSRVPRPVDDPSVADPAMKK